MKKLIAAILLALTLSVKAQNPTLVYGTNGLVTIPANQHTGKVSVSPVISGAISNDLFQFNGSSWVPSRNITISNFVWSAGTPGSVIFVGSSGQLFQDNPNFFWDDTNNRLGIATNAPAFSLDVNGTIRSISSTIGVVDSTPNPVLLLAANGGAGTITNSAIASIFTGSINAPTNTALFVTTTNMPSAINVIATNGNWRTFVNVSMNLTSAVAGMSQGTLRTQLGGVTNDISTVSIPAGAILTYIVPVTGFVQPNSTYWVTNQSTGTATATINYSRSSAF